jgi:hypothetical protein
VSSQEIVEELQQLEQKLATLRVRAEEEESTFSELEGQVQELSGKLVLTRREVADLEGFLAEKRTVLARAELDDAIKAREEAVPRLAEAISQVLGELDVYDRAQKAVTVLQGPDARAEPEIATESWERLVNAVQKRIHERYEDELVEAALRSRQPSAIQNLPEHLRKAAHQRARERRRSHSSVTPT